MSKKSLLDEDEEVPSAEQLRVNEEFANRFEHNKKREELHRLQAKHPEIAAKLAAKQQVDEEDDEESSSTTEEEDDGYIPEDTERRIFETLLRIKRKDPSIYDSNVAFFPEEPEEDEEGAGKEEAEKKGKGEKPMFLKDVLARQALERCSDGGSCSSSSSGGSSSEDEGGKALPVPEARKPKAYDAEQEQLRRSFIEAAKGAEDDTGEADGFEGVLKKRSGEGDSAAGLLGSSDEDADGKDQDARAKKKKDKKAKQKKESDDLPHLLDEYFAEQRAAQGRASDPEPDPNEQFLKSFILNRGWVDQDETGYVPTYNEVVGDDGHHQPEFVDDEEDEQYLENTDRFEAAYNFRFEEPGNAKIASHPREIEGTVRKEDDRRKRQRESKKQRKEAEMSQHAAEIKRLKNLKKKEIEEKLALISKVAGAKQAQQDQEDEDEEEAEAARKRDKKNKKKGKQKEPAFKLDPKLLEEDFDPEAWDRQMAEAFNDDYYAEEDEDAAFAAGEMGAEGGDLFAEDEEEQGPGTSEQGTQQQQQQEQGASKKGGLSQEERAAGRAEMAELLEQYFKLDHEGEAGGQKTRFRYKQVPPNTYGLTAEDLLFRDDKELNQIMGLKKLAPYREDQHKQRPNYKALQALRASKGEGSGKGWQKEQQQQQRHKGGFNKAGNHTPKGKPFTPGHKRPRDSENGDAGAHSEAQGGSGGSTPNAGAQSEEKASRLASYAKLSLNKPGKGDQQQGGNKQKKQRTDGSAGQTQQPQAAENGSGGGGQGSGLTKAQKKNLKRHQKRREGRASQEPEGQ